MTIALDYKQTQNKQNNNDTQYDNKKCHKQYLYYVLLQPLAEPGPVWGVIWWVRGVNL